MYLILLALGHALNLFEVLAKQTPTKVDDELVDLLKAIKEDPTIGPWFGQKYNESRDGVLSITAEPPAEVVQAMEARGIKWQRFLEMLPTVIAVVKTLIGK